MEQKLEYINQGRCGYVVYKDNKNILKLFFEFGGGNCITIIYVPSERNWENATKIKIEDREKIVRFIGEQCVKNQAPNCVYELHDDRILLVTQ